MPINGIVASVQFAVQEPSDVAAFKCPGGHLSEGRKKRDLFGGNLATKIGRYLLVLCPVVRLYLGPKTVTVMNGLLVQLVIFVHGANERLGSHMGHRRLIDVIGQASMVVGYGVGQLAAHTHLAGYGTRVGRRSGDRGRRQRKSGSHPPVTWQVGMKSVRTRAAQMVY